jgi:hypothetical protein
MIAQPYGFASFTGPADQVLEIGQPCCAGHVAWAMARQGLRLARVAI